MARQVATLLQQLLRGVDDAALLATIDARGAATVAVARAQAHLHYQHHTAMHGNEVEFAAPAAEVAQQDFGTCRLKVGGG